MEEGLLKDTWALHHRSSPIPGPPARRWGVFADRLRDRQGYPLLIHKGPGEAETKHEGTQAARFWDTQQEGEEQAWPQSPKMLRRKLALGAGSLGDRREDLDATVGMGSNETRSQVEGTPVQAQWWQRRAVVLRP